MKIYFFCPDYPDTVGGVKQIYRQVDVLNKNGFSAYVLHQNENFRCNWFENETAIAYIRSTEINQSDYIVFPEEHTLTIDKLAKGVNKVIFNQNAYYTFRGYPLQQKISRSPYFYRDVKGVMCVSENNKEYLQYVFPKLKIHRIFYGVDPNLFKFNQNKQKRISFIARKRQNDILQVINILRFRKKLKGFDLFPIQNLPEKKVAEIMNNSMIYLNFGTHEGSPMPPSEAMHCGCIVVGYDGFGGKEYFKPEFSYPVESGNILDFCQKLEIVIDLANNQPEIIQDKSKKAYNFVKEYFSMEKEETSILAFWNNLL